MKIIDVAEFYAPRGGGVRTYIDLKLQAAAEYGHELVVIAPGAEDREERRESGRIIWVASPQLPLDPRYRLLVREKAVHALLDREAPDVIEASSPWTGAWIAARYRAGSGRPLRKSLVYHHDPVAVYPQTWLGARFGAERVDSWCGGYWRYLQRLSGHFDLTVVSGAWLARRLAQHGVKNSKAVAFGVDKALFQSAQPDPALRRELLRRAGAQADATLFIAVSRLHPEKRLGTLLAAIKELAKTRPVALVVYGDGPFAEHYRRRARGLPIYFA
ncbi:MAG TPA: glycosyltransferase, partial [Polyangiales bacterium]|nr:glycosyltransferase [Polyangiales bacterium]